MILVDAKGVPAAVSTGPANPHESGLIQELFGFILPSQTAESVIGDSRSAAKTGEANAYDSDHLDEQLADQGIERIAPNHSNRSPSQGRSPLASLQETLGGRAHHRLAAELPPPLHPLGEVPLGFSGLPSSATHPHPHEHGFGIGSTQSRTELFQARRERLPGLKAKCGCDAWELTACADRGFDSAVTTGCLDLVIAACPRNPVETARRSAEEPSLKDLLRPNYDML
jgi:hypothetical protein